MSRPLPTRTAASSGSSSGRSGSFSSSSNGLQNGDRDARSLEFAVNKCPHNDLTLTNLLYFSPKDFSPNVKYILANGQYLFNVGLHDGIAQGEVGPHTLQRQWARLSFSEKVSVLPYDPFKVDEPIFAQKIVFEITTYQKGKIVVDVLDTAHLAKKVLTAFSKQIFTRGQPVLFKENSEIFVLTVNAIDAVDKQGLNEIVNGSSSQKDSESDPNEDNPYAKAVDVGVLISQTKVLFFKSADAQIKLEGDARRVAMNPLIQPDFRFDELGIGGLDKEFAVIFRRAFASRTFPPDIAKKLGIQHVKGILLYGPPGTGKTLMARQIAKMLNAVEPLIVNGPEILNKFVGQSEENVRKLFAAAEKEYKEKGDESQLHIIIFDELDAICKQRGSKNDGTGVSDSVVNQLLSKMDGVEQLNNILLIGMTNRLDMIDEALLRPGRLELKLEISLPDEKGRLQILNIHTEKMKKNNMIDSDVNFQELAAHTKNFSGAEIAGLVKAAASFAMNRHVKVTEKVEVKNSKDVKVRYDDFKRALGEVKAAFGASEQELSQCFPNGIVRFGSTTAILETGARLIRQVRESTRTPLVSVLLHGPSGAGKTALAAVTALASDFFFIKMISPQNMVGYSEASKASQIAKVFADAHKSTLSVIVVDDLERLLEWVPLGPRLSNTVLQTLLVLLKTPPPPGRKLLILATCTSRGVIRQLDMSECFNYDVYVPNITDAEHVKHVLDAFEAFDEPTRAAIIRQLNSLAGRLSISVKQLLMLLETAGHDDGDAGAKFIEMIQAYELPVREANDTQSSTGSR